MSLTMTDVSVSFPDGDSRRTVLDRVSLQVPSGRFVGLTGPSGSGKSTLLAVAGTLLTPGSGTVTIDGFDLAGLSARERDRVRRERLGLVFQADNLLPALTAVEQLLLVAHLRRESVRQALPRARALLAEVGLGDAAERRPAQLSGGMRQRVNIARALMGEPTLLLIDEPTAALDAGREREVLTLLSELVRRRDLAALLVSHDSAALAAADEVLVLVDGRLGADHRLSDRIG